MASGADPFPVFTPALATIDAIQNAQQPFVVTSFPHTFLTGESIRFIIPREFGMTQLNEVVANIIDVPTASSLQVDIDTTFFDTFVVPVNPLQCAQAVPVGENALMLTGAFRNVLPYT